MDGATRLGSMYVGYTEALAGWEHKESVYGTNDSAANAEGGRSIQNRSTVRYSSSCNSSGIDVESSD